MDDEYDLYDDSLEGRNGQSICNEQDFAELVAAKLDDKNIESNVNNTSEVYESSICKNSSIGPGRKPTNNSNKNIDHSEPVDNINKGMHYSLYRN